MDDATIIAGLQAENVRLAARVEQADASTDRWRRLAEERAAEIERLEAIVSDKQRVQVAIESRERLPGETGYVHPSGHSHHLAASPSSLREAVIALLDNRATHALSDEDAAFWVRHRESVAR